MQQPASGASPEDIALDKQVLRAQIRPRRLINRSNRAEAGQADYARRYREGIYSLIPRTGEKLTIAAYLPTAAEPPITDALQQLHHDGHRILVPVVRPGRQLAWDLRLVPALAYGRNGRRLGQGGGYYDRLLPRLSEQALRETTVGVVFADEVLDSIPYDTWDGVLYRVLTENGVHPLGEHATH